MDVLRVRTRRVAAQSKVFSPPAVVAGDGFEKPRLQLPDSDGRQVPKLPTLRSSSADQEMLEWLTRLFSSESPRQTGRSMAADLVTARIRQEPAERALQQLAQELSHIASEDAGRALSVKMLHALDECAQKALDEIRTSLRRGVSGHDVSERAWSTLATYYDAASSAYCRYLSSLSWQGMSAADYGSAAMDTARAVRSTGEYMLLRRLRYRAAGRKAWKWLGQLFTCARANGYMHAEGKLYLGAEAQTSVEREVLMALLSEMAPASNLSPSQMSALTLLLRLNSTDFRFCASYDEWRTPFAWEPKQGEPPQRWSSKLPMLPGLHFFGLGSAYSRLCMELESARSGHYPEWLPATGCGFGEYVALIDRLVAAWSLQPPVRQERRVARSGELLVAYDWGCMVRLVRFSELARSGRRHGYESTHVYGVHSTPRAPADRTFNYTQVVREAPEATPLSNLLSFESTLDPSCIETWRLEDASDHGLGAAADCVPPWARVGMMIAVRPAESAQWEIAFIRRIACSETGRCVIGMTRYAELVYSARLHAGIVERDDGLAAAGGHHDSLEYDALLAPECTLLVQSGRYDSRWKYVLRSQGRCEVVTMDRFLERGLNFERVEMRSTEAVRAA